MARRRYAKPAEAPEQLLARLEARGLAVPNRDVALRYLRFVGGYRLKGYWFHLTDPSSKKFPDGTSFEYIAQRYEFDRVLRALTFAELGQIEVALRGAMSNYMSAKHGAHWYMRPELYKPTRDWGFGALVRKIEEEVGRSKTIFVTHYDKSYDEPHLPPSWGVAECVTFGFWSRTYSIILDPVDRKAISMKFGIREPGVLDSWLYCLTYLRNLVCHHGRILRAHLVIAPQRYKAGGVTFSDPQRFFAPATVMNYLLKQIGAAQRWQTDLEGLFARFPSVAISEIGFAPGWERSWMAPR